MFPAAYLAELARILPVGMVPDGYAVPFWFYHDFMEQSGLYETAAVMMADPAFQTDPVRRDVELVNFVAGSAMKGCCRSG
jgi:hypothetical protein